MTDMNVKLTAGKINLSRSSQTLTSFKVTEPFSKVFASSSGKTGPGKKSYAKSTAHPELGGGFTTADVLHPEGTIVLLQAMRTRNGAGYASAGLFLRLRSHAAMLAIKSVLPTGPESLLGDQILAFSGCADLISVEELRTLGIEVPRSYVNNYMEQEEVDELFSIQVIRAESQPAPSMVRIATSKGVVTKAVASEPVRRIRVRRS